MIFTLIISLVSIAVSAFFPFIKYLNHKEYNKYKDAIDYEIKMYTNYKDVIEFYLKNGYQFDMHAYMRDSYRKCYDLYISICRTAGTRKDINDLFGVKELKIYDVNDYILLSFLDSYGNGFTIYNANSIAFCEKPNEDESVLLKLDLHIGYLTDMMFMSMIIDYCNGKLDYLKKLIKGYDNCNLFLYSKSAIYNIKYLM